MKKNKDFTEKDEDIAARRRNRRKAAALGAFIGIFCFSMPVIISLKVIGKIPDKPSLIVLSFSAATIAVITAKKLYDI